MQFEDRAIACFKALSIGDAIGKQTETLSRAEVQRWYPGGVTGFHGKPGGVIPRYIGKRYEWRIGETTDDTEQTLAVARALLHLGRADHTAIGQELLHCQKSLHPGVSLWDFVQQGDPARIATTGNGCGAAMRAAPIGILYPSSNLDELIRAAYECAIPTHGGQLAIAATAAVAAAVSAALDGLPASDVLATATQASTREDSTIASSIQQIYSYLASRSHLSVDQLATRYFPNKPETIVPLAICLALVTQSAQRTILVAANAGGDSDSVASIGGAIAGALAPDTVNDEWFEVVRLVNSGDLIETARGLARQTPRFRRE
jgi:ADP-ribosylglycohydrolase